MAKFNSVKKKFVLSEINDYSAIHTPLKSRIKYTCFDVSQSFIVLGATSGGLYVFRREPCTFLQLLPNKEGPITDVLLSPDEKLIAFATERCVACVVERTYGGGARLLNRSVEHAGSRITALQWVHTSDQVFIGDSLGRLSVINVSLFMSKNIFQIPAFIFMQLDSSVVQISCHDDMLLVSTTSHSYVCDTTKEQYRQIGTKLRDGEYGACYHGEKIYCARPGSRLWEVDLEGTVHSTHQFKQALAVEPALIVSEAQDGCIHKRRPPSDEWPQQSFNFAKLSVIGKFLFTFKADGVYVFNPETVDVVLWSDRYRDIIDAKCFDDTIYIWTKSQKVHALTLVTLDKCLLRTYFRERYKLCHSLCSHFASYLLESPDLLTSLNPLINLSNFVDCDENVSKILKAIESVAKTKDNYTQLESGIYLVDNHHARQKLLLEGRKVDGRLHNEQLKINNKIRNPRSHSLPPDAKMRQKIGGSVP
ncbi:hypothetical protein LSTR_LSTR011223 [Laodelphax striatellus]|uniref:HPS5-like beta-propeller domain-containing protein n=1 Tax=Laodelphax striatellus TaxID=195883 RepID=A0A482XLI0_LAOST|nr:hypothetical protein LSTR_LSTR011223 [Laodelphax striatellus]